jgi:hypothetical protein
MSNFDEMTPREVVAVGKKITGDLWPVSMRTRNDLVNACVRFMEDEDLKPATRMGAMQIILECTKQNLVKQKMDEEVNGGQEALENKGPKVVLLLPPNLTEAPQKKEVADAD